MHSQGLTSRIASYRAEALTVDDLEQALQLTDKAEIADESPLLQGIIRFSGETVKEIMTPRVDLVDIDISADFSEVLSCVTEKGYSRIPVFSSSEDNIKGVLYTKDLLPHTGKPADFQWQRLIRQPYFVPETKMIDDLLHDFQKNKVHIAIVVDEFGGTSGIVTMEDILEEIVGEINDEYDELKKPFIRLNQRTYIFEGKCLLVDLSRILSLPDDFFEPAAGDADTLAGLLLEIKGEFPKPHERIAYRHLTFEVMEMDQRRIVSVKIIVGNSEP
ncbi:MAG: CBS domain-containing protein, partial [Prevotella sp.]|nr:CBS domain-containing protein [Prevotella sp.]